MTMLAGRRALVVGSGAAVEAVATALEAAGAAVARDREALTDAHAIAANIDEGVDILVHGGVALHVGPAQSLSLDEWRTGFSADIDGRFLHAAEFARKRIAAKARGAVLFLMPSATPGPGRTAQVTAHGALDNLTKSLAVEWSRSGVRTNAIASRAVEDFENATNDQRASLGQLASYLVSDHAAYITGTIMGIDELSFQAPEKERA